LIARIFFMTNNRCDFLFRLQLQEVYRGNTLSIETCRRDFIRLQTEDASLVCKEQEVVVSTRRNKLCNYIFFLGCHTTLTFATPVLTSIVTKKSAFNIIFCCKKYYTFLFWDKFLIREFTKFVINNPRTALITVFLLHLKQFSTNHF